MVISLYFQYYYYFVKRGDYNIKETCYSLVLDSEPWGREPPPAAVHWKGGVHCLFLPLSCRTAERQQRVSFGTLSSEETVMMMLPGGGLYLVPCTAHTSCTSPHSDQPDKESCKA